MNNNETKVVLIFRLSSHPLPPPVDGQWAAWIEADKSDCNDACVRTETFVRSCTNPTPQHGGHHCTGNTTFVLERACKWDFCGKIMRARRTRTHTHTHTHARTRAHMRDTNEYFLCVHVYLHIFVMLLSRFTYIFPLLD